MPTDLYSSHFYNVIVNWKSDIMTTLIFMDLSEKMLMAERGIDETSADFVGKMTNTLNLLTSPMCPRQHKAKLSKEQVLLYFYIVRNFK